MKLSQLLSALGGSCAQDPEIRQLTCDSREARSEERRVGKEC